MNKRFTKLIAALALLVGLTIPMGMWGQSTVTFDATTDITENASSYQSTELTINAADGSVWTANGYGATANTNIIIGKGGANYLRTPSVEGTITSVTVTWSGNTNYFLALQTTTGTELDAKSNHAELTTETFTVSGNYAQLQLVGRRNSGTSNAAATITQVVVTYTPGSAPQPTTYTVTFDAGEGTFVGNTSFPNASNTIEAGTYELPSATRDGYTFNGWVAGENEPVTGEYTVSGDVDFTAAYTENTTPTPQGGTDVLDRAFTGVTENTSSYSDWSGKTGTSGAVYAGNSAGGNNSIQLRSNNSNSGVITTVSGGKVTKVVVTWNSNTSSGRTLDIYGKNTAYEAASDLYNSSKQGTKLGSIVFGTSTTLNITGDYEYIGLRSNSGAMYLSEIQITWVVGELPESSVTIDASGITNTDVYSSTEAGTLSATVMDGQNNPISGAVVEWASSNNAVATIDANGVVTLVHAGEAVITATFDGNDGQYAASNATYTLNVTNSDPNPAGTEIKPYTVAQARAAIDANNGVNEVYATGIVTAIPYSYTVDNGITFNMVDVEGDEDFLQAYKCVGDEAPNVRVGDVAVVYGNLIKYGNTYEFNQGCEIVSLTHSTTPVIEVEQESVNLAYDATEGSIGYSIQNVENAVATVVSSEEWLTIGTITSTSIALSCSANNGAEDRTATVTLSYDGAESVTVTVTQGHYSAPGNWVLTNLEDLTAGDVFVIVGNNGDNYAMKHTDATSSAPTVVAVTVAENTLSGTIDENIQWNLTVSSDGYTFYPAGSATTWLYCISNNNGLRVSAGNYPKVFIMKDDYLYNVGQGRYVGIYNSQDWRSYTSINNNIANQTFAFYKKVSDDVTYTKDVAAYEGDGGYVLMASPVCSVAPSADNGFLTSEYDLYAFDQAEADEWRNYKASSFNLVSGKGYLYASSTATTLTFVGQPYNGNGLVTLDYTEGADFAGWNLIGNPYATAATLSQPFYRLTNGSEVSAESETGSVNAMEGVFVVATEAGQTVTFSTENNAKAVQQVVMNVTRNRGTAIDRAIVRFDEGDQLPKFQLNPNNTKLYIAQGNKDYAVVRSAAQGEMPVSFRAAENGTYTLSIETENVEMDYLHLIDNMTGMDVDLLQTPNYTFEAKTSDYASRFRLVFSANSIDEQNAETFAFFNGSEWMVSNLGEATLQVVDVMGRVLSTETISGNAELSLNQPAGVYMLRLINGNDVKVQKVIVR